MAKKKKSGIGSAMAVGAGLGLLATDGVNKLMKQKVQPGGWASKKKKSKKKGFFS